MPVERHHMASAKNTSAKKPESANGSKATSKGQPSRAKGKPAATIEPTHPQTAYEQLSLEHQRFVDEYLIDMNGTRAYMRCPAYAGVSYESAQPCASRLLRNVLIKQAVEERQADARKRLELTKDNVLRQLARMAMGDPRRLYRDDGTLRAPHELDDECAAMVQQIEVFEEFAGKGNERELIGYTRKVRLVDRKGALELAMKNLGLVKEKVEHDVKPGGALAGLLQKIGGTASALPVVPNPNQESDDQ